MPSADAAMNSSQSPSPDRAVVVATTTWEEQYLGRMIRNQEPARVSSLTRRSTSSSLGVLDSLPGEILLMVLRTLDFQSLSRLLQVSISGKELVEGLAAYQDMVQYAPEALTALGKTGLLKYHPATILRQTLYSKECVSCGYFGGFLLLSTCHRVCFDCLDRNTALRAMRLSQAKSVFGLSDRQLRTIPIMKTIPAEYRVRYTTNHKKPVRLVNVGQAKRLAIEVHGSVDALEKFAPPSPPSGKRACMLTSFHQAPLEMPGCDMSKIYRQRFQTEDHFGGATTIRFPFVSSTGPDIGRLCRGCALNFQHHRRGILPQRVAVDLLGPSQHPYGPLYAGCSRLRTEPDFLMHIQQCYGVTRLLANPEGEGYHF